MMSSVATLARLFVAMTFLMISAAATAHHSFAIFDKTKLETVKGVIGRVEWTNPHVYLVVGVPDTGASSKNYTFECASINILTRAGWKISTVKVGYHVSVNFNPLRDGKPGGLLVSVTLPDGTVVKE